MKKKRHYMPLLDFISTWTENLLSLGMMKLKVSLNLVSDFKQEKNMVFVFLCHNSSRFLFLISVVYR